MRYAAMRFRSGYGDIFWGIADAQNPNQRTVGSWYDDQRGQHNAHSKARDYNNGERPLLMLPIEGRWMP